MKKAYLLFILLSYTFSFASMQRNTGENIVIDKSSSLMWQDEKIVKIQKKTWTEAISYCENLNLGNHSDWRLPNVNELLSIFDFEQEQYNLTHPIFKYSLAQLYWSNTSFDEDNAWYLNFNSGISVTKSTVSKTSTQYIRCVRNIQKP